MNTVIFKQNQLLLQILLDNKKITEDEFNWISKEHPILQNKIINNILNLDNKQ